MSRESTQQMVSEEPAAFMALEDCRLGTLARLAREAGSDCIAGGAEEFARRVVEGRFYVACVGQFKRGKSSLINALVGETVLPVGVVPVTAAVTVLRYGRMPGARVRLLDGRWQEIKASELATFVSEEQNPDNRKGVTAVEVFVPADLLSAGMCLIDTPGLGSVFAANAATTRAFVPHIDAALVVLGADPPITADELALVKEVAAHSSDLIFVLNKADRLSEIETGEARVFCEQVIARHLGWRPAVLQVSATERLASGITTRDWNKLCQSLEELTQRSGSSLLRAAEERGAKLFAARLLRELDNQQKALVRPLEQSEGCLETLRRCVAEAERSMNDLGYLFAAEAARLGREFARCKTEFLAQAGPQARAQFRRALDECGARRAAALRSRAVTEAQEISTRLVDAWLPGAQRAAEKLYLEGSQRFVKLANGFLERLASSGEPGLAALPHSLGPESGFRVRSRFHHTELWGSTTRTPIRWLIDAVRTRKGARGAVEREVSRYLERILFTNATRVQYDFNDRVLESRRRLECEIQSLLRDVYHSAERALVRAQERRAAGSEAVQAELRRIESLRQRIEALVPSAAEPQPS
ncbi:MAG: dynamin family protein [Planctomycetota bacterium]